jgi:hypothetical protein
MVFLPNYDAKIVSPGLTGGSSGVEFRAEWQDFTRAVERIGLHIQDGDMLFTLCAFSPPMTASPFYV